jgi:hypothetical protein
VKTADLATFIYLAAIPFGGAQVFNGIRERDALFFFMRIAVELLLSMLYFDWAISLCTHESWTRSVCSSRPMRWLGDISMSFYQIHMIVFDLLVLAIGSAPAWIIAVSLVTSLFIGWLTYRYVEKPAQRLVLKYCLPKRIPKVVNSTAERTGYSAPDNVGRDQPSDTDIPNFQANLFWNSEVLIAAPGMDPSCNISSSTAKFPNNHSGSLYPFRFQQIPSGL